MRSFDERNPFIIGAIGIAIVAGLILTALNYDKLPFFNQTNDYTAYFTESGGLLPGAAVQVSGVKVGLVEGVDLDGAQVSVTFNVADNIVLGDRTEAAIKTKSLLGAKILEVTPRGTNAQSGPIPKERTRPPYQLPDALGDLSVTISGLDTDQLSESLSVLSTTFKDTPPQLRVAIEGVGRFSDTLDKRDDKLRDLLASANKSTAVLAERADEVVGLVKNTNALLVELRTESDALDSISLNLSAVAQQIKQLIAENRETLRPALDKLNGVLTIVDNRKERVRESIQRLGPFAMSLGESVSSAPFFKAYLANLLPGQFVQPFIDAAFSDLGLDPNVKLPSELTDPPVGQPGTPALPMPYPRTGQGGEPRLTIPDAVTGNPGDQRCGPPGNPQPGPGCYPYREPVPAPPPGGPPPGPPADAPAPNVDSTASPTPSPVYVPAPGEPQPADGDVEQTPEG